jgi:thiamine-phosphate pyrophosphorylase
MQYQFTPAAQRALRTAAGWTSRESFDELEAPGLLLGLLAESECRAAITLAAHRIDAAAVRRRWPGLAHRAAPSGGTSAPRQALSADVELSIQAACERLAEYPPPLELATEHLLLGLIAADHEVSNWLREQGLEADSLEAEIHKLYGHRPGPLPMQPVDPACGLADLPPNPPMGEPTRQEQIHVLRVVDAEANRAREGLRAVEDYVRFVLDDRHLTGLCKQLRHDLAASLGRIATEHRLAARETQADVGTELATESEGRRDSTGSVLAANFTRLQEALRSLEEFGKLLDPDLATELEQLRYRTYTLHRAMEITRTSLERLDRARLYVLIDSQPSLEQFERLAGSLVEAGVHMIQLRDKTLDDRRLLERARLLRELTRQSDTLFVMNDRPDLAVLSHADGVHVGQEELSIKDARTIVGPDTLIGISTHTIDQARQAQLEGANYIGVGPVFRSDTKHFDEFPGVELLRAVATEIRLPAFAVGGITRENLPEVLAAGFSRVAVSGPITTAADPAATARELLSTLP